MKAGATAGPASPHFFAGPLKCENAATGMPVPQSHRCRRCGSLVMFGGDPALTQIVESPSRVGTSSLKINPGHKSENNSFPPQLRKRLKGGAHTRSPEICCSVSLFGGDYAGDLRQ